MANEKVWTVEDTRNLLRGAPAQAASEPGATVEQQLEAETGHDVVKTSNNPPTFVETVVPRRAAKANG